MIRDTSIGSYREIEDNGLLSRARFIIYEILFSDGPLTAGEIFTILKDEGGPHSVVKGSVCARLTELRRSGVVREVSKRICSTTGMTAIVWDVTSKLPTKFKKSYREELKEVENKIRKLIKRRKALLSIIKGEE